MVNRQGLAPITGVNEVTRILFQMVALEISPEFILLGANRTKVIVLPSPIAHGIVCPTSPVEKLANGHPARFVAAHKFLLLCRAKAQPAGI